MAGLLVQGMLECVLGKRWRVNYGVNPVGKLEITVPFHAKDAAPEKTEFGNPDMAIMLTMLSYYYSGLSDAQLSQCFIFLEKKHANPTIEYNSWVAADSPDCPAYSSINLENSNLKARLFQALRKNMHVVYFWLDKIIFPKQVKQYPLKISCNAWDLCGRENGSTGFSGTNDMSLLLPRSIHQLDLKQLEETNQLVRAALVEYGRYNCMPGWSISTTKILERLSKEGIRVLMDAGALIIDMSNSQVAKEWLRIERGVQGVVYFNERNKLTVMTATGAECPFEFSALRESLGKCCVYLDDEHTRGTDLKFPDQTVGCVTLGGAMTRDKLVQASMRLRLLQNGHHRVSFLASQEAHVQIQKLAGRHVPDSSAVLQWVEHNSREFQNDGLVMWAASALNNTKKNAAFHKLESSAQLDSDIRAFGTDMMDIEDLHNTNHKEQTSFVLTLPKQFELTMQKLATDSKNPSSVHKIFQTTLAEVLAVCEREIPNRKCFSVSADDEQEREIEQEIEKEVEVSRPRSATACAHRLDDSVKQFVLNGSVQLSSNGIQLNKYGLKDLYVTADFEAVVHGPSSPKFLRNVHWFASLKEPSILLLLSPYEVNELIPLCSDSSAAATLHMFAPRLRQNQDILNNPALSLAGSQGLGPISGIHLANLHIFSGSIFLDSAEEVQAYLEVLNELKTKNPEFNPALFVEKIVKDRYEHFPEACDVFKIVHGGI